MKESSGDRKSKGEKKNALKSQYRGKKIVIWRFGKGRGENIY